MVWSVGCSGGGTPATDGGVAPEGDADAAAPGDAEPDTDSSTEDDAGDDAAVGCSEDFECMDGDMCNGEELCIEGICRPGEHPEDGHFCDTDGDLGTVDFCIDGRCLPSRCGDRLVAEGSGEQCDDGNIVPGDGCDRCRFTCTEEEGCGECEVCAVAAHVCVPAADASSCSDGLGVCEASTCLLTSCDSDADCDDGNLCNGEELCAAGTCELGTPLDCDDGDACTVDYCHGAIGGCISVLDDNDGDGHASASLGVCGDDCDDTRPDVFGGASEPCDGIDNDCDGAIDEEDSVVWYADCDDDGFARLGAVMVVSCEEPPIVDAGCMNDGADWSQRAPTDFANADCNDWDPAVNPWQRVPQARPIPDAMPEVDYDYDCDGVEETTFDLPLGECVVTSNMLDCALVPGWLGEIPECGDTGLVIASCRAVRLPDGTPECVELPNTTLRVQRCL